MRNASKIGAVTGAIVALAAAGLSVSSAVAGADPAGHVVRYTLTSGAPYDFNLYFVTAQPASKAVYNADAYSYVQNITVNVGPDAPWTSEATFTDPQWALLRAGSTAHGGIAPPNVHCDISVDGQPLISADGPYNALCQGTQW